MRITKIDESAYLPEYAIQRFSEMGTFKKYDDRPSREEAIRRLNETDVAIVEWTSIDREMFGHITGLKYIVVALTGYEFVDVVAAKERGILVSNLPTYSRQSVAEHAFALLLAVNRRTCEADHAAREGKRDYFEPFLATELYEKTLGIVGLGNIGSWIAKIGQGFGMNVIGCSRKPKSIPSVRDVGLEELLRKSDVVVVSVDYNDSTAGMLSRERLALLKPTSFVVSIAPPGILDEAALADMLAAGKLSGVGLDIPQKGSPLEKIERSVLTPGIAWYTQDSLDRSISILVTNVEKFIAGKPQNVVNA